MQVYDRFDCVYDYNSMLVHFAPPFFFNYIREAIWEKNDVVQTLYRIQKAESPVTESD